jgi:hypothetical protein
MKPIKEMTEQEILAEIESYPEMTETERAALESNLYLRAYILGWTGDPLCQPASSVLAAVRQVRSELGLVP